MALKTRLLNKTVATAGTRERLTDVSKKVAAIVIQALPGNTGTVYVGDNQVSATNGLALTPGSNITFSSNQSGWADEKISLKDIWLDVGTGADKVIGIYLEKDDD